MTDGARLGAALMQRSTRTITPAITLRGTVFGDTARELAEDARDEAYEFFKDVDFELDIDVSVAPDRRDTDPKFIGSFYACSR